MNTSFERLTELLIEHTNNEEKIHKFFSPGRINFIGEHIDYLGGKVVPGAIDLGISAVASKSNDVAIYSLDFENVGWAKTKINVHAYSGHWDFIEYVNGVISVLLKYGYEIKGFNAVLSSTIPIASGLSSSAAFGILIFEIFNSLYDLKISHVEMAKMFKEVENIYIGLKNGIMDQFIIANGKADNLIVLDTNTLDYEFVSGDFNDYKFLIFNTSKPRALAGSKYNERVRECKEVLDSLAIRGHEYKNLSEVKHSELEHYKTFLDDMHFRRLKHVVTENERVTNTIKGMKENNFKLLGEILNESHESLSRDYEVSCEELDFIHKKIQGNELIMGGRMIGAGFGGCFLALVNKQVSINDFDDVINEYHDKFLLNLRIYEVKLSDGVREIK